MHVRIFLLGSGAALFCASPAIAQTASAASQADEGADSQEIVVTANKREQNQNKVGLSITAVSGEALAERNLSSLEDVVSIVPGLSFSPSASNTPILTLRGVGFNETSLGVYPAVTVYSDQVPIVFPAMSLHSAYDLERVEVLKGPQGTLFGQNSTGGAINYIAAKPTKTFEAGADVSYGRFNSVEGNAFISGPLSDTVRARLALTGKHMDDWQYSYTRRDTNGHQSYNAGRLLLDWDASSALKFSLNLNGWKDTSQPQAGQLFATHEGVTADKPSRPSSAVVSDPLRDYYSPPSGGFIDGELSYPFAPRNARAADWSGTRLDPATATQLPGGANDPTTAQYTEFRPYSDRKLLQGSLRADLELGGGLTLTSLTSYAHFKQNQALDADGMAIVAYNSTKDYGLIKSFNQELRIANDPSNSFRWLIGGNYEDSRTTEDQEIRYFGNSNYFAGNNYINSSGILLKQKIRNYAFFGSVEQSFGDRLTLKASGRYTNSRIQAYNSAYTGPNGNVGPVFNYLGSLSGLPFTPLGADALSYSLNSALVGVPSQVQILSPLAAVTATNPLGLGVPGIPFEAILGEDNFSWRVGVDFQATPDVLLYANVSRGYKAGSFPVLAAASYQPDLPVTQESVTAYEVGFKGSFLDRKVQLNMAGFYYDYRDKQVRGKYLDPVFGLLDLLVNVPKSRIYGAEAEVTVRPVRGLTINGSATYLDAKIKNYVGYNIFGGHDLPNFDPNGINTQSFAGSPLPYTPKWSGNFNVDYKFETAGGGQPFVGFTVSARSSQDSAIGADVTRFPVGPRFRIAPGLGTHPYVIHGYATLDARVGYEAADGEWRVALWGKNITNKYYVTAISSTSDQSNYYAGMPATYGVTLSVKLH